MDKYWFRIVISVNTFNDTIYCRLLGHIRKGALMQLICFLGWKGLLINRHSLKEDFCFFFTKRALWKEVPSMNYYGTL